MAGDGVALVARAPDEGRRAFWERAWAAARRSGGTDVDPALAFGLAARDAARRGPGACRYEDKED